MYYCRIKFLYIKMFYLQIVILRNIHSLLDRSNVVAERIALGKKVLGKTSREKKAKKQIIQTYSLKLLYL